MRVQTVIVDLPYPAKALWPNGRAHYMAKARETGKHREWAWWAATGQPRPKPGLGPIPIKIIVHAKPRGPLPDRDGVIGAAKSYLDGISDRIGVNDKHFAAPTVEFSPERTSRFVIEVGT